MHAMSIFWLRAATGLYFVGLIHAVLLVLRKRSPLFPLAMGCFRAGVIFHFVAIVELGISIGHVPVDNFFESVSLCAWLIALVYLVVCWRYRFAGLGVCIFPLVFVMTQVGAMELPVGTWANERVRDAWLLVHIVLILLGYAGLLLTALASVFYLIQERRLKSKKSGSVIERLPPLATLDNLVNSSMGFGFVFITFGLVVGMTWGFIESGTRWITDPKIAVSFVTWLVCLLMIFLRATAGWRGRKAAVMALTVLGCLAVTWAAHVGLQSTLLR